MAGWRPPFRRKLAKLATGVSECRPLKGKALLSQSDAEGPEEADVPILSFLRREGIDVAKETNTFFEKTYREKKPRLLTDPVGEINGRGRAYSLVFYLGRLGECTGEVGKVIWDTPMRATTCMLCMNGLSQLNHCLQSGYCLKDWDLKHFLSKHF